MRASVHAQSFPANAKELAEVNLAEQLGEPVEVRLVPCKRCPRAILVIDGGNADGS